MRWRRGRAGGPPPPPGSGNLIPLTAVPPGGAGVVRWIGGGRGQIRRIMEMGLTPGSPVTVVANSAGPVVVSSRGVTLAIGRGLASKIMVEVTG